MTRNQFRSPLSHTATRIQAASSRASLDADLRHTDDWGRKRWTSSPDFPEVDESVEQTGESIKLPFSPIERGREEIRGALTEISTFQNPEKERIYRHAKEFYVEECETPSSFDVIDICQTLQYASENGHEDWLDPLRGQIKTFFDGVEESSLFLRQTDETEGGELDIIDIREIMQERYQSMREATEKVYGSPDEEPNNRIINEAQKSYLWALLRSSNDFNNLPLE